MFFAAALSVANLLLPPPLDSFRFPVAHRFGAITLIHTLHDDNSPRSSSSYPFAMTRPSASRNLRQPGQPAFTTAKVTTARARGPPGIEDPPVCRLLAVQWMIIVDAGGTPWTWRPKIGPLTNRSMYDFSTPYDDPHHLHHVHIPTCSSVSQPRPHTVVSRPGPRPPWLRSRPTLGPESLVARPVADPFLGFPQPPDKCHSITAGRPDYRADSSQLFGLAVHMEILDQAPLLPALYQDNCDALTHAF